jgi:hypothetical protein
MPSPESRPGGRSHEQEPVPYYRAARFRGEKPAGRAYNQAQAAIFTAEDCDLSTYRFHLNKVWHVAVLGQAPPPELEQRLEHTLSGGEPTTLPEDMVRVLAGRRAQATQLGPWIERHQRPGERP